MSLYLNVGSGQRPFGIAPDGERWVNLDSNPKWYPDIVCDARSMTRIKTESVRIAVAHHVLEHLWADDAKQVCRECYRVLEPDGSLLVFVPDMRMLAKSWMRGEMDDQLYFTNVYGAYMGNQQDIHRWGYTSASLTQAVMDLTPWKTVKTFDWRHIPGASIAKDFWILGIEAIK